MEPKIALTGATLGAIVTDLDLGEMDPATWKAVEAAFLEHALLIFPGQGLSSDEQVAFASRFGEIEAITSNPALKAVPISNVRRDGTLLPEDECQILRGNEGWHTDSSYMPLAAKASVLSARVVASEGGETEWVDMRAAYDALDAEMRGKIANLSAYHSLYYSQARIGHHPDGSNIAGFHEEGAPLRPLVKQHPATGRNVLFLGRHANGIPGLPEDESEALIDELMAGACQAPRIHRHAWQVGDVAIWDNRAVLHRARPYDYEKPRVLVHTRVAGDPRTELAETDPSRR